MYDKDWKKVTAHVRTRISAQVRSHAQKVLKDYSPNSHLRIKEREQMRRQAELVNKASYDKSEQSADEYDSQIVDSEQNFDKSHESVQDNRVSVSES